MKTRTELLIEAYTNVVNEPWSSALSGQERVWFLVYNPTEQRKVDLHLGEFEYKEEYFANPEYIVDQLEAGFIP